MITVESNLLRIISRQTREMDRAWKATDDALSAKVKTAEELRSFGEPEKPASVAAVKSKKE
jgi:hypothetical protein